MSASNLAVSFAKTIDWEGGARVSRDRNDAGNWTGGKVGVGVDAGTDFGVSAPVAVRHGWTPGAVTREQAGQVFKGDYWDPCGCDGLPDGLDHCVSDHAYNAGPASAASLLRLTPPGDVLSRIKAFSTLRLSFLRSLAAWRTYGAGWGLRVGGVERESIAMAMAAANTAQPAIDAELADHAKSVGAAAQKQGASAVGSAIGGSGALAATVSPTSASQASLTHISSFASYVPTIIGAVAAAVALALIVKALLQSQRAAGLLGSKGV